MQANWRGTSTLVALAIFGTAGMTGCSAHRPYVGPGKPAHQTASYISTDHQAGVLDAYQNPARHGEPQVNSYRQVKSASWGASNVSTSSRSRAKGSSCFT